MKQIYSISELVFRITDCEMESITIDGKTRFMFKHSFGNLVSVSKVMEAFTKENKVCSHKTPFDILAIMNAAKVAWTYDKDNNVRFLYDY